MKITILCVGKVKEKFYRDALAEYAKRLGKYCRFEVVEVADEQTPDKAGAALEEQIKAKEAERLLSKIKDNTLVCTLEIAGKKLTSEKFAEWMEQAAVSGRSDICFVIGGSLGLHQSVTERADFHLSFSDMTFPHQLMRVILAEQIYRGFRIINGEPYHK
jgi:23S rRNA (pseudouridine1915-N3)-methyltransferase